jgi:hypothetical protein
LAWFAAVGLPLIITGLVTFNLRPAPDPTPYAITNPGMDGSRALAQVLRQQGVNVIAAKTLRQALALAGPQTTLAIVGPQPIASWQIDRLTACEADLVLGGVEANVRIDLVAAGVTVEILPDLAALTNAGVAADGQTAAHIIRSLGQHQRLVWYIAQWEPEDQSAAGLPGVWQLLPPPAGPIAVQLLIAAAAVAWWRGRRFGRLVPENLPVAVPAAQTAEGRGRLYRRARAYGHTAAGLRAGSLSRLGLQLGFSSSTPPAAIIERVAQVVKAPPAQIGACLLGQPPSSETELVQLANDLAGLEQAVVGQLGPHLRERNTQ